MSNLINEVESGFWFLFSFAPGVLLIIGIIIFVALEIILGVSPDSNTNPNLDYKDYDPPEPNDKGIHW